jgi:drug/metabolite transporter (DMT)-like permease
MLPQNKGLLLVLFTGLISGISIFLNKFAVSSFDAFVYTFLKNAVVAVLLFAVLVFVAKRNDFRDLSKKHWKQLAVLGLTGGSVAFLLYFYALKLTSAVNAGFLHKTLFVFATVFAFFWLKEKPSKAFLIGGLLLLAGNFLVFSSLGNFTSADLLIVVAVVLWSLENVYAKKVLKELSGLQVAFGRMFFGSLFILAFLFLVNDLPNLAAVSGTQWQWLGLTSVLLFGFVATFYSGLKWIPVSHATAVLSIGQPITALLSVIFVTQRIALSEATGLLLLVFGSGIVVYSLLKAPKTAWAVSANGS